MKLAAVLTLFAVVILFVAIKVRERIAAEAARRNTPPAGAIALLRGQQERAIEEASAAAALAPGDFRPLIVLSCAALVSKQYDKADEYLRLASTRQPDAEEIGLLRELGARRRLHSEESWTSSFLAAAEASEFSCASENARIPPLSSRLGSAGDDAELANGFAGRAALRRGRDDQLVAEAATLPTDQLKPVTALLALDLLGTDDDIPDRNAQREKLARVFADARPNDLSGALLVIAFRQPATVPLSEPELADLENALSRKTFSSHAHEAFVLIRDELVSLKPASASEAAFQAMVGAYPAPFNYRLQQRLKATTSSAARVALIADSIAQKTRSLPTVLDRSWARSWAALAASYGPTPVREATAARLNADFARLSAESSTAFGSVARFPIPSLATDFQETKAMNEVELLERFRESGCLR